MWVILQQMCPKSNHNEQNTFCPFFHVSCQTQNHNGQKTHPHQIISKCIEMMSMSQHCHMKFTIYSTVAIFVGELCACFVWLQVLVCICVGSCERGNLPFFQIRALQRHLDFSCWLFLILLRCCLNKLIDLHYWNIIQNTDKQCVKSKNLSASSN